MTPETNAKIFTMAVQNYRQSFKPNESAVTQLIWYNAFKNMRDDMMETAINLVFLSCKFFPNVADIKAAINELRADLSQQSEPKRLAEYYDTEQAKQAIQTIMDLFRSGNIPKNDLVAEIRKYAKSMFPDISDDLIYRNYNELLWCKEREELCSRCLWTPEQCDLQGNYPYLTINKNGSMTEHVTPCKKRMARVGVA